MSRMNVEDVSLYGCTLEQGTALGVVLQTLTGTTTIADGAQPIQSYDPGGAGRTVLLPAEADSKGVVLFFSNWADAAETLTIKEDSNTTTIITVAQAKGGIVWCDGVQWRGIVSA